MGDSVPWGQSINQLQDLVLTAMCEGQLKERGCQNVQFPLHSPEGCRGQLWHFTCTWHPQL